MLLRLGQLKQSTIGGETIVLMDSNLGTGTRLILLLECSEMQSTKPHSFLPSISATVRAVLEESGLKLREIYIQ